MAVALPLYREPPPAPTPSKPHGARGELESPRSVRLSLTDRCDLACVYCRPHRHDGYVKEKLDLAAWKTMVEGLVLAGVRRVRLTGGEPLLHPDVVPMVAHLATLGLDDIALTTNATRLATLAKPLKDAGLHRVNISLDTLQSERFHRMTRGGRLDEVLAGVEAALRAPFPDIKLNVVVVRGENDGELEDLVRWSWERGITPRFLEIMKIGDGSHLMDRLVTADEMRERLSHLLEGTEAVREPHRGPARYVRARHEQHRRVGFITGTSDTYCKGCDRLRVASDGVLRPCLATSDGLSAAHEARTQNAEGIREAVSKAWTLKPDGTTFKGCTEESATAVSIRAIGG